MYSRRSRQVAYIATFGALAGLLSFLPAFPGATALLGFPILSYLLIDPAEIFDFLAYFIGGPAVAIPTAIIHCLVLLIAAVLGGGPFFLFNFGGAFVKLAAVLCSFLGMSLGLKLYARAAGQSGRLGRMIKSSFSTAAIVRVLILLPINVLYIVSVAPLVFGSLQKFLDFPRLLLRAVGVQTTPTGFWDVMVWILLITSIYNLVQLVLAAIPSYILLFYILRVDFFQGQAFAGRVWIASRFRTDGGVAPPKANT